MSAIAFLAIAVAVSALGGLVLYVRHRQPNTLESGLDAFRREMDALAPPVPDEPAKPRRRPGPARPGASRAPDQDA